MPYLVVGEGVYRRVIFWNGTGGDGALPPAPTPPPTTTAFDPANKHANLALSNADLTVTCNGAAPGSVGENVRSVASHATGKYYCEYRLTASPVEAAVAYGLAVAAFNMSADGFLGTDAGNSLAFFNNGQILINNAVVTTIQTWTINDVIGMAVDRTANLIWFRTNAGNWNNSGAANPAAAVGGISLATLAAGAIFAAIGLSRATDVLTANFGATAYAQAAPAGFGNW